VDLAELLIDPEASDPSSEKSGGASASWRTPKSASRWIRPRRSIIASRATRSRGRELCYELGNGDRAFGATLAGNMALGLARAKEGGFAIRAHGYAGQGLGFALHEGMHLSLEGFANDTVGEAMGGGVLVIRPPREVPEESRARLSVCGNAAAYGATGGRLFVEGASRPARGRAQLGATIVVEGAGKYAFEYMTGGVGVVLGPVGPVVGSGLTGGALFLLDEDGSVPEKVHKDALVVPLDSDDTSALQALIEEHHRETGSTKAKALLDDWDDARARFRKVVANTG
jgi:glutamate synthase domain-containing protein 3